MNIKITNRTPEGVIVDLTGSEVKSGGKTTLSVTDEQFRALVNLFAAHLAGMKPKRGPKAKAEPIDKGKHP